MFLVDIIHTDQILYLENDIIYIYVKFNMFLVKKILQISLLEESYQDPKHNMGLVARTTDFVACKHQRHRHQCSLISSFAVCLLEGIITVFTTCKIPIF